MNNNKMNQQICTLRWRLRKMLEGRCNGATNKCRVLQETTVQLYDIGFLCSPSFTVRMIELSSIKSELELLPAPLSLSTFLVSGPHDLNIKLLNVEHSINDFIRKFGGRMELLLEVYDIPVTEFLSYHLKMFNITSVTQIVEPKQYQETVELQSNISSGGTSFSNKIYPFTSNLTIERIAGASLYIHHENYFLRIDGWYEYDPHSFVPFPPETSMKLLTVRNKMINSPVTEGVIESLSVRDKITSTLLEIEAKVNSYLRDIKQYESKIPGDIIKIYNAGSPEARRKILICLTCSDNERNKKIAGAIYQQHISEVVDITWGLPWNIQQSLNFEQPHPTIPPTHIQETDINYEDRVNLLLCSPDVKESAMQKVKEMKSSRENSSKAEAWVDGLLKIPFGIYKEETMFTFAKTFHTKVLTVVGECVKELGGNILGELERSAERNKEATVVNTKALVKDITKSLLDGETTQSNRLSKLVEKWTTQTPLQTNYIKKVSVTLDNSVYGHKEAKNKLRRLIAQFITGGIDGQVFGLVGPPGTGKTTLAKKGISQCLEDDDGVARPFIFIPLGGSTNGSQLEGHSYTYVGSTWGKIADSLMQCKVMNPILFFDELDKVSDNGKEIISILTHLTDKTQNETYYDRYFKVPLDLSKAIIIFSYNDSERVDPVLKDRINEIKLDPLSMSEKRVIVEQFILPEISLMLGYDKNDLTTDGKTTEEIVELYTYEPGVRKLKEVLLETCREFNLKSIMESAPLDLPYCITMKDVERVMKVKDKIRYKKISETPLIGVINGLYATQTGIGGITLVQVLHAKGCKEDENVLQLTGCQGDVMKESMQCAKTIALTITGSVNVNFHIHCPAAGTKKDGPSAGAAITCAMISRLTGVPIRNTVGVTGEIDLHGNITAIGGLEAKIEGARRAGVTKVVAPLENENDFLYYDSVLREQGDSDKCPEVVFVSHINELIPIVMVKDLGSTINIEL